MADITNVQLNTQITPVPGTGTTVTPVTTAEQRGQEALARLESGQTIEGRVVSVETSANGARTAMIDLGGDTLFSARLDAGMAITEGTTVSFQVRTTADGQINLNPLYQNTALDSSAMRALLEAGMSTDANSLQMVREMMTQGLSVDRESLQVMARAVNDFPNAEMNTLMQLRALDIPVTENNITQMQNYQNYQHQIVNALNDIMNGLPAAFQNVAQTGNAMQALDLYGALMRLFTNPEEPITELPYLNTEAADASAAVQGDVTGGLPGSPEGQATLLDEEFMAAGRAALEEGLADLDLFGGSSTEAGVTIANENAQALDAPFSFAADGTRVENAQGQAAGVAQTESFADLLKAVGLPEDAAQMPPEQLFKALSDHYQQTAHMLPETDEAWGRLFVTKEFDGLLKGAMNEQWLLRPEDVQDKGNIEELYTRLKSHTQQLSAVLNNTLGAHNPVTQQVNNLNGNLDFMNQLNQMFQYVQLPLQLQNQNAHGDLYVYTNKKSLAREDGSVSAILHLDMEALGPLDVYVKMRDAKVSTNFYLASDEAIDLIAEHIGELNEKLARRGYTMEARMMLQSEMSGEDAAVDEMLRTNPASVGMVSELSFDARA
ncbi:MAG: flagellar hook-length control protein FliK [Lachnospiraceae bacterium]|nr:flagellar hook-length control protein FliK [Lachnospiraceae bacterium]